MHDKVWDVSEKLDLVVDMLDMGTMGRYEDLSDFDKGQIILSRWLGWSLGIESLILDFPSQQ